LIFHCYRIVLGQRLCRFLPEVQQVRKPALLIFSLHFFSLYFAGDRGVVAAAQRPGTTAGELFDKTQSRKANQID
jgi:hypothetical protein